MTQWGFEPGFSALKFCTFFLPNSTTKGIELKREDLKISFTNSLLTSLPLDFSFHFKL